MFRMLQDALKDSSAAAMVDSTALTNQASSELFGDQSLMQLGGRALSILVILVIAWIIIRTADKASRRWIRQFDDLPLIHPKRQRAATIRSLLVSSTRYVIWPLAFITALDELDVDVAALIATAGIAGIAIGFGAQSLVKDIINGVLLLFDDSIHVGDLVRIGTDEGLVESIGVRTIRVRRFNGELLMVPAGELRIFGNRSIDFARVIVSVGLSYGEDAERVMAVMQRVADAWAQENKEILKEDAPTVQGLTDFADSSVNARVVVMVVPGEQFDAERSLRVQIKKAFDEEGIEIPFPQRTVHMRDGGAAREQG